MCSTPATDEITIIKKAFQYPFYRETKCYLKDQNLLGDPDEEETAETFITARHIPGDSCDNGMLKEEITSHVIGLLCIRKRHNISR